MKNSYRSWMLSASLLFLTACVIPDPLFLETDLDRDAFPENGKAIVITGLRMEYKRSSVLSTSVERDKPFYVEWLNVDVASGPAGQNSASKVSMGSLSSLARAYTRATFMVEPGTYIMTYFRPPLNVREYERDFFGLTTKPDIENGGSLVPTFTVNAGEVVYIGSQFFRHGVPGVQYEVFEEEKLLAYVHSLGEDEKFRGRTITRLIEYQPMPSDIQGAFSPLNRRGARSFIK